MKLSSPRFGMALQLEIQPPKLNTRIKEHHLKSLGDNLLERLTARAGTNKATYDEMTSL